MIYPKPYSICLRGTKNPKHYEAVKVLLANLVLVLAQSGALQAELAWVDVSHNSSTSNGNDSSNSIPGNSFIHYVPRCAYIPYRVISKVFFRAPKPTQLGQQEVP